MKNLSFTLVFCLCFFSGFKGAKVFGNGKKVSKKKGGKVLKKALQKKLTLIHKALSGSEHLTDSELFALYKKADALYSQGKKIEDSKFAQRALETRFKLRKLIFDRYKHTPIYKVAGKLWSSMWRSFRSKKYSEVIALYRELQKLSKKIGGKRDGKKRAILF